jgi:RNA polymerase sigma factor (sigma-70 family)
MTSTVKATLLERMRGVILHGHGDGASDAELLTAYLADRSEHAFRAIVRRHGAMVLGACRRVTGDVHDADDAFQATFLVLVRRAASVVPRDNLAGWLYGVAYRTALKAKAMKARRFAKEQRAASVGTRSAVAEAPSSDGPELRGILDRELAALPDCFRLPVLLCDLEGKSRKEAARQLGCGEGTLSGRLARGRRRLAQRLVRQGISLGAAGGVAACLSQQALAGGPPASLVAATVKAGTLFSAGDLGGVSATVADLLREVLQAMFISKLKSTALGVAVLVFGLSLTAGAYSVFAAQRPQANEQLRKAAGKLGRKADGQAIAGKIYVHRRKDPAVYDPRDKDFSELPPLSDEHKLNYQPQHTRLSPDGRFLAIGCIEPNTGTPPQKLRIRAVGKDDEPDIVVEMPGKELSQWSWSPDGKKLTFAVWDEGDGQYHPWIVDVASKKAERIKLPELPGKIAKDYGAVVNAWSPDDLWVVFSKGHFHLMEPGAKETRKLNEEPTGFYGAVRVAPDGKKLLYIGMDKNRKASLRVIDLLLGKTTMLADLGHKTDISAAWSPDSRQIVCSHADANDEGRRKAVPSHVQLFSLNPAEQPRTLMKEVDEWLIITDWR